MRRRKIDSKLEQAGKAREAAISDIVAKAANETAKVNASKQQAANENQAVNSSFVV